MSTMKILVQGSFFEAKHIAALHAAAAKHGYSIEIYKTVDEAIAHAEDAEIIYAWSTGGGNRLAEAAKDLKWFCSISAGVDQILKPGILADNTLLSNSAGAYGLTIAEHMIMVTIMLLRRYPEYNEIVRHQQWSGNLQLRSIKGSTLTILGTGDIGTRFAERAKAFGPAKIIGINRSGRRPSNVYDVIDTQDNLEKYLGETDILYMALPGTKDTTNMMTAKRIAMLPKSSFIVNVGRGNSIDQEALIAALNNDELAGAALDVMVKEPLPAGDPLWTAKNVLITPHISGKMTLGYTRDRTVEMFIEDLDNYVAGKPLLHAVNKALGY